jgi:hypothetical protein
MTWSPLFDVCRAGNARTRSISAENPRGEKGGGAAAEPGSDGSCTPAARRLGRGWKVRPCLRDIEPGRSACLADVEGPGVVQHVWCTCRPDLLRALTLRVTYDGQRHPSIAVPLGDFFANGLNGLARLASLPVAVNPRGGMNCWWPMPFRRRLSIELVNDGHEAVPELFYQISYALGPLPEDALALHACWRRSTTRPEHPEHVILEGVSGRGHYAGTYLVWMQHSNGWWGEGEVKFHIDGDPPDGPTICGTGTEDYFGGAWGFTGDDPGDARPVTYAGPFMGYPQAVFDATPRSGPRVPAHALYRWHLADPVRFERDLRVSVQALGWWPDGTYQPLADDIASVAFWYQTLPGAPLPELPAMPLRWAR